MNSVSYADIDAILLPWAASHSFDVTLEYKDEATRSIYVVNAFFSYLPFLNSNTKMILFELAALCWNAEIKNIHFSENGRAIFLLFRSSRRSCNLHWIKLYWRLMNGPIHSKIQMQPDINFEVRQDWLIKEGFIGIFEVKPFSWAKVDFESDLITLELS